VQTQNTADDIFTLAHIESLNAPNIIVWAVPVMIFLVLLEWAVSAYQKREYYNTLDTLSAAAVGIGNLIINAFLKVLIFSTILYCILISPFKIPPTWWSFILCIVVIDFCRYWAHRWAHEVRFLWATHVTHHSSVKYNFSVSFRLGWTQHVKVIFFVPAALCGFDPIVFFICHQIEVLYQFWIHTEYIVKLPRPIEYFFTTPSHHRVHHATNDKYINKNYGSTFIIWDRIFGTFQPEEERPIYGITHPVNSYNPVYLNFHEWIDIFKDTLRAKSWKSAFLLIFGNPEMVSAKDHLEENH
jgi:sterol desaturase/sphingolipid hydroxylase (fatty acid hydroxylase superfamily)